MDLFIKCVIIAVLTAISSALLKRYLPEVSIAVLIIACVMLIVSLGGLLGSVIDFISTLSEKAGIDSELLTPVFKVSAIAILSKIACDICNEVGASALITVIELCASTVSIILSMPLFNAVIGLITRM